jgi:ATP-dependent RNA helicase RhlB
MNDPLMVEITPDKVTADRVTQCCYMVGNDEKIPLLIGLLRRIDDGRVMVFINTKRQAELVWGYLEGNGIESAVLSGDVPQKQRLRLLRHFQEGKLPGLVATDVAARGLHIPDVSHVVNYDLQEDAEDYVHRIGRTARAGAAGDAISFACETYAFCLPEIEEYIGAKIPVEAVNAELLAEIAPSSRVRPPRRETRDRDGKDGRRHGGHGHKHKHDSAHKHESKHSHESKHKDESEHKHPHKAEGKAETDAGEKPKKRRRRRSKPKSDRPPQGDGSTSPSAAS